MRTLHHITQAPAPSRPIDRCMACTGLLAHVLVSKYCDYTPLYRHVDKARRRIVEWSRQQLAALAAAMTWM